MTGAAARMLDDPSLRAVLDLLNGAGEEARVVGGAVRNALAGRPVHEHDIATTATPDVVMARARTARLRTIPTGLAHGTVTMISRGVPFEVTTLREDVATDGRHATIRFGRDFAADARRRDFTMNALSLDRDGRLHDTVGGVDDLRAGRVRFIGDARTRIREDYLRTLRFFRFSADFADGPLDADGLFAAIAERAGLAILSRERIRAELMKLLAARRASAVTAAMAEGGLLGPLLRGVPQPARLARLAAITGEESDLVLRLAALSVQTEEDAERLRDMLRLSNAETTRLGGAARALAALHGAEGAPAVGALRTLLFTAGREGACDGLRLAHAESRAAPDDAGWQVALRFLQDTPEPHLPFSGSDLIARGLPGGRPLGQALKRLQAAWIRAGFPEDPRTLADLLDTVCDDVSIPARSRP